MEGTAQQACLSSSEPLGDAMPLISYFFFEDFADSSHPSLSLFFLRPLLISVVTNKSFLPTLKSCGAQIMPHCLSQTQ